MGYKLVYTKRAVRDIKKLDPVAGKKLKKALERLQKRPFYYGKKLISEKLGKYKFRVGNYRVVFDIDRKKIVVLRVGHRREIYKR